MEFVSFIDTRKGKKLLKVFKSQRAANMFLKKNTDKILSKRDIESVGTMSKKEWDTKEAKYAIEGFKSDAQRKAAFANGYEEKDKKNESGEDINNAVIPGGVRIKLQKALDIVKGTKLSYQQKLQVVGRVLDSLSIDKKELSKISSKLKTKLESINEASKLAMGIAGFTGTRGVAVQKFIDDYNLDAKKLFNFVKKGKLKDRMEFVTAIAGKPGNKFQGKIVGMFGESIAEDKNQITKVKKQSGKSEVKFYDILSKVEKKLGSKYNTFLDKSLKDFKQNPSKYKTNADKEERLFQLA